jgi:periplasmic copper chaperone A
MSLVIQRRAALLFAALTGASLALISAMNAVLATDTGPDGKIRVEEPWARASAGAATTGAAYLTLKGGAEPDALVGVSTPVAASAEVHESLTENGVSKMRATPSLPIPAGKVVTLAPGAYHIMLVGLKHPLTAGQTFPLTLTFSHAAPVTVDVKVQAMGHGTMPMHQDMQKH